MWPVLLKQNSLVLEEEDARTAFDNCCVCGCTVAVSFFETWTYTWMVGWLGLTPVNISATDRRPCVPGITASSSCKQVTSFFPYLLHFTRFLRHAIVTFALLPQTPALGDRVGVGRQPHGPYMKKCCYLPFWPYISKTCFVIYTKHTHTDSCTPVHLWFDKVLRIYMYDFFVFISL